LAFSSSSYRLLPVPSTALRPFLSPLLLVRPLARAFTSQLVLISFFLTSRPLHYPPPWLCPRLPSSDCQFFASLFPSFRVAQSGFLPPHGGLLYSVYSHCSLSPGVLSGLFPRVFSPSVSIIPAELRALSCSSLGSPPPGYCVFPVPPSTVLLGPRARSCTLVLYCLPICRLFGCVAFFLALHFLTTASFVFSFGLSLPLPGSLCGA